MIDVAAAVADDRDRIAAMFARAFHRDPAFSYIMPDEGKRMRRLVALFRLIFDSAGRAGMRFIVGAGDGVAASLWRGPGRARVGHGEMLARAAPLLAALGGDIGRALRVSRAIDAHMPAGPFWYLQYAGCAPGLQRTGLGAAVIRAGLMRAPRGMPCYLETANEANAAYYARFGFGVTAEWTACRGGPCFLSLTRPADPPG